MSKKDYVRLESFEKNESPEERYWSKLGFFFQKVAKQLVIWNGINCKEEEQRWFPK